MDRLPSIGSSSVTARIGGGGAGAREIVSPSNNKRTLAAMITALEDDPKTSPRAPRVTSAHRTQQLPPVVQPRPFDDSGGGDMPLVRGTSLHVRNAVFPPIGTGAGAVRDSDVTAPVAVALDRSDSRSSLASLLRQQQQMSLLGTTAAPSALAASTSFGSARSAQTPFMFHEQHGSVIASFEATASTTGALLHASSSSSRSSRGAMSPASRVAASLSKGPSSFSKIPSMRSAVRVALQAHKVLPRCESESGPGRSSSIAGDGLLSGVGAEAGGSGDSAVFATGDMSESAAAQNASGALRHVVECACRRFLEVFDHSETRPLSFSLPSRKSAGGTGASMGGGAGRPGRRAARNSRSPEASFVGAAAAGSSGSPPAATDTVPAAERPHRTPRHDSLEHSSITELDDLGRGEDALRRYRDWTALNRSALPGASGMKAYLLKESTDQTSEIENRLISRTTQWLERHGLEILSHQAPPDVLTNNPPTSLHQVPVPLAALPPPVSHLISEAAFCTCQCPRELNCAVMAWRHRRSGSAFQRGVLAVSTALRRLMVPGALISSLFMTTYALGGSLVTATWMPPLIGVFPVFVEPGSWLSDISKQITASLLGSFFTDAIPPVEAEGTHPGAGSTREDHIAAVDFYPCADGSYCAVPSVHLIDALTMHRFEMVLAGEASERVMHGVARPASAGSPQGKDRPSFPSPPQQQSQSPSSTMSAEDLNRNRTVDVLLRVAPQLFGNHHPGSSENTTILRDLFHANGMEMREILVVRNQLDRLVRSASHALSQDHVAALKSLSHFMLSEAVARTLKAMMLSRVASQLAGGATLTSVGAAETSAGLAVDIHNPSGTGVDDPLNTAELAAAPGGRARSQFRPTILPTSETIPVNRNNYSGNSSGSKRDPPPVQPAALKMSPSHMDELPPHVTTTLDAVNLVFRKFLTSSKFLRDSLAPALLKRYGTVGDIPGGVDPKTLFTLDMVAFLEHRLGFFFDARSKTFQLTDTGISSSTSSSSISASHHHLPSVRLVGLHGAPVGGAHGAGSLLARSLRCSSTSLTALSQNGVVNQRIATDITATYLQRLSNVCLAAEQARKKEAAAGRAPASQRLANAVDVAEAVHLVYTIFPILASAAVSEGKKSDFSSTADDDISASPLGLGSLYGRHSSTTSSTLGNRSTYKRTESGVGGGTNRVRTGVGPSVLRLLDRLLRVYQLPLNAIATFHHTVALHRNSACRQRQLVAAMDSFDAAETPRDAGGGDAEKYLNGATASATFDTVVQPLRSAARDNPGNAVSQSYDTNGERQPVFFFTIEELSTLAELFCITSASKRHASLIDDGSHGMEGHTSSNDKNSAVPHASPNPLFLASPTHVAACDAPIVCFVAEQVTLLQSTETAEDFARVATEHLIRIEPRKAYDGAVGFGGMLSAFTPATTALTAARGGGASPLDATQFREMHLLILWSSSLRCLSAIFEPFLLHHTTRALLAAKLVHRRSTHWWIDYLHRSILALFEAPPKLDDGGDETGANNTVAPTVTDAAHDDGDGDDDTAQGDAATSTAAYEDCVAVLTAVCEAVMIGSTATLVGDGSEASFLLSFALGIATQRSSRLLGQSAKTTHAAPAADTSASLNAEISFEIPAPGNTEAHAVPQPAAEATPKGRSTYDVTISRFSSFAIRCASELLRRKLLSSRDPAASSSLSLTTTNSSSAAIGGPTSASAAGTAAAETRAFAGGGCAPTPHADCPAGVSGVGRPDTGTSVTQRRALTSCVAVLLGALLSPFVLRHWVAAAAISPSASSATRHHDSDRSSSLRSLLSDDERRQRLTTGFHLLLPLWSRYCAKLQDVFLQRADARRSPEPVLTPRVSPAAQGGGTRGEPDSGVSEVLSSSTPTGTPSDSGSTPMNPHHQRADSSTTGVYSTVAAPAVGHSALLDEETCYQLAVAIGPAREYLVALLRVLEDCGLPALGASARLEQQRTSVVVSSMLASEPQAGVGRASVTDALVAASSIALTDPVRARAEAHAKSSYLRFLPNLDLLQSVFEGLQALVKPTDMDLSSEYCKPFLPGLGTDGSQLPSFDIPEISPLASGRHSMPDDGGVEEDDLVALVETDGRRAHHRHRQTEPHEGEQQPPHVLPPPLGGENPTAVSQVPTSPTSTKLLQPSPAQLNLSSPPAWHRELSSSVTTDYTNQPPSLHGEGTNEFRSFTLDDLRVSSEQARRLSQLIGSRRSTVSQELPPTGSHGGFAPQTSSVVLSSATSHRTEAGPSGGGVEHFSQMSVESVLSLRQSHSNHTNELSLTTLSPRPPPTEPDSYRRGSHARRVLEASRGSGSDSVDDGGNTERHSLTEVHKQQQWIIYAQEDMLRSNILEEQEEAVRELSLRAERNHTAERVQEYPRVYCLSSGGAAAVMSTSTVTAGEEPSTLGGAVQIDVPLAAESEGLGWSSSALPLGSLPQFADAQHVAANAPEEEADTSAIGVSDVDNHEYQTLAISMWLSQLTTALMSQEGYLREVVESDEALARWRLVMRFSDAMGGD